MKYNGYSVLQLNTDWIWDVCFHQLFSIAIGLIAQTILMLCFVYILQLFLCNGLKMVEWPIDFSLGNGWGTCSDKNIHPSEFKWEGLEWQFDIFMPTSLHYTIDSIL